MHKGTNVNTIRNKDFVVEYTTLLKKDLEKNGFEIILAPLWRLGFGAADNGFFLNKGTAKIAIGVWDDGVYYRNANDTSYETHYIPHNNPNIIKILIDFSQRIYNGL